MLCIYCGFSLVQFHSRLHSEELAVYGKELEDLKDFLDNNPHLCSKSE